MIETFETLRIEMVAEHAPAIWDRRATGASRGAGGIQCHLRGDGTPGQANTAGVAEDHWLTSPGIGARLGHQLLVVSAAHHVHRLRPT